MTNTTFLIEQLSDMIVLQRVFREAKFCQVADDDELSTSPVVSRLFGLLIAALIEKEREMGGAEAAEKWTRWLAMNNDRDEWFVAVKRAAADVTWLTLNPDEKNDYTRNLFSPFVLSQELLSQFIESTNNAVT